MAEAASNVIFDDDSTQSCSSTATTSKREEKQSMIVPELLKVRVLTKTYNWLNRENSIMAPEHRATPIFIKNLENVISSLDSDKTIAEIDNIISEMLKINPALTFNTHKDTYFDTKKLRQRMYKIKHSNKTNPKYCELEATNDFCTALKEEEENSLYTFKFEHLNKNNYGKECSIEHRSLNSFEIMRDDVKNELDRNYKSKWGLLILGLSIHSAEIFRRDEQSFHICISAIRQKLKLDNNGEYIFASIVDGKLFLLFSKQKIKSSFKRKIRREYGEELIHLHGPINDYAHIVLWILQNKINMYYLNNTDIFTYIKETEKRIAANNNNKIFIRYELEKVCFCQAFRDIHIELEEKTLKSAPPKRKIIEATGVEYME